MGAVARFRQEDVKRAVAGAKSAGMRVTRVEIDISGKIVVLDQQGAPAIGEPNPWDKIFES